MERLHVNASLPRAGSELLQCLLMQHPKIYASATSPLLEYWYGAYSNFTLPEVRSQPDEMMELAFRRFCRFGTLGYYGAITDRPVVIDKNRGWTECAEMLWSAFPGAKMIGMVRAVPDILHSLDKAYRKNIGHPETRNLPRNQEERFKFWLAPDSKPLGLALSRMQARQALGPDARIKYVEYEDLVASPIEVMRNVYEFLELDAIDVDPNNVEKQVPEDCIQFGIFGNHDVRRVVSPPKD